MAQGAASDDTKWLSIRMTVGEIEQLEQLARREFWSKSSMARTLIVEGIRRKEREAREEERERLV